MEPTLIVRRLDGKSQPAVELGHNPPIVRSSDAELLNQVVAGIWEAFDPFVDRYERRLIAYLSRRVGPGPNSQVVDDLAQETFLRIFRAARSGRGYAGTASVATWLFAIANNVLRDHVRSHQRQPITLASDLAAGLSGWDTAASRETNPAVAAEQLEGDDWVSSLLAHLPAEQAEVITLKVVAGLRFAEVAEVVGAPITTVKSRMTYGLRKIWTILNQQRQVKS